MKNKQINLSSLSKETIAAIKKELAAKGSQDDFTKFAQAAVEAFLKAYEPTLKYEGDEDLEDEDAWDYDQKQGSTGDKSFAKLLKTLLQPKLKDEAFIRPFFDGGDWDFADILEEVIDKLPKEKKKTMEDIADRYFDNSPIDWEIRDDVVAQLKRTPIAKQVIKEADNSLDGRVSKWCIDMQWKRTTFEEAKDYYETSLKSDLEEQEKADPTKLPHYYLEQSLGALLVAADIAGGLTDKHTLQWLVDFNRKYDKYYEHNLVFLAMKAVRENWKSSSSTEKNLERYLKIARALSKLMTPKERAGVESDFDYLTLAHYWPTEAIVAVLEKVSVTDRTRYIDWLKSGATPVTPIRTKDIKMAQDARVSPYHVNELLEAIKASGLM